MSSSWPQKDCTAALSLGGFLHPPESWAGCKPGCTTEHRARDTVEMEEEESCEMGQERVCRGTVVPCRWQKHNEGKPVSKEEMGTT